MSEEATYHDLVSQQEEEAVHQNSLVPQLLDGAFSSAPNAVVWNGPCVVEEQVVVQAWAKILASDG